MKYEIVANCNFKIKNFESRVHIHKSFKSIFVAEVYFKNETFNVPVKKGIIEIQLEIISTIFNKYGIVIAIDDFIQL